MDDGKAILADSEVMKYMVWMHLIRRLLIRDMSYAGMHNGYDTITVGLQAVTSCPTSK